MRLAARLCEDPLGSYSAPPDRQAIIRGKKGGKGKERVVNSRKERNRREGKDMKGWGGKRRREGGEGEGSGWGERVGKGEGGLDLNICQGVPTS